MIKLSDPWRDYPPYVLWALVGILVWIRYRVPDTIVSGVPRVSVSV